MHRRWNERQPSANEKDGFPHLEGFASDNFLQTFQTKSNDNWQSIFNHDFVSSPGTISATNVSAQFLAVWHPNFLEFFTWNGRAKVGTMSFWWFFCLLVFGGFHFPIKNDFLKTFKNRRMFFWVLAPRSGSGAGWAREEVRRSMIWDWAEKSWAKATGEDVRRAEKSWKIWEKDRRDEKRWEKMTRHQNMRWGAKRWGSGKNWEGTTWDEMKWDRMTQDCGDNGMEWAISRRDCVAMRAHEMRKN